MRLHDSGSDALGEIRGFLFLPIFLTIIYLSFDRTNKIQAFYHEQQG
jgi:hypothetical protein